MAARCACRTIILSRIGSVDVVASLAGNIARHRIWTVEVGQAAANALDRIIALQTVRITYPTGIGLFDKLSWWASRMADWLGVPFVVSQVLSVSAG